MERAESKGGNLRGEDRNAGERDMEIVKRSGRGCAKEARSTEEGERSARETLKKMLEKGEIWEKMLKELKELKVLKKQGKLLAWWKELLVWWEELVRGGKR